MPNDMHRPTERVAVIGAGTMGSAMTRRLLHTGFSVAVWDRSEQKRRDLADEGVGTFGDPREAVRHADVVLTLLPTADAVQQVMMAGGVAAAIRPGAIWAQMGTIGVKGTEDLVEELRASSPALLFVDAPVSGSRGPADAGQLVVLASGPDDAREGVAPVFAALGRRTLWLGPAGSGTRMKLVLNTWLAFEIEAAAEARALATHLGIADAELASAVTGSPLVSAYAGAKLGKMRTGDDGPEFALAHALKDLNLVEEAGGSGVTPIARAIAGRWKSLAAAGWGASDVTAARHGLHADDTMTRDR